MLTKRTMVCGMTADAKLSTGKPVPLRVLYVARPVEAPGFFTRLLQWLMA